MIVEVGFLFLISAMVISFMGSLVPLVWSFNKETNLTSLISPIIVLVFLFTLSSLSILIYSFSIDDFSVKYVAQNSNINLPNPFLRYLGWVQTLPMPAHCIAPLLKDK